MANVKYSDLLSMEPSDLLSWFQKHFFFELPGAIASAEECQKASELLVKITGYYSYAMALLSYAQLAVRDRKRSGEKKEYEDMVDRRTVIDNFVHILQQQYAAISRSVTIYFKNLEELRMSDTM